MGRGGDRSGLKGSRRIRDKNGVRFSIDLAMGTVIRICNVNACRFASDLAIGTVMRICDENAGRFSNDLAVGRVACGVDIARERKLKLGDAQRVSSPTRPQAMTQGSGARTRSLVGARAPAILRS